ncbi:MAG: homoserine kinase [Candidatus Wallbacteria bacterium]|nr:homoserine kinase [Candidatus Wallbacteria bacterium]
MPVKTTISEADLPNILTDYDLGEYRGFKTFANGAGQTTLLLETSAGKFVLRYYENRPQKHVFFEIQLLNYLRSVNFPVPAILKNRSGELFGTYKEKPFIIIEFVEGEHGENPNDIFDGKEVAEVIKAVASLHNLTKNYTPEYFKDREIFDVAYCWKEFVNKHSLLAKSEKGKWFKAELDKLEFPASLPKGLCHADLNYGNFLFKNGKIVAVLDFDMSFYTYLIYDIASLIYWWTWPPGMKVKEKQAAQIVSEYSKSRELSKEERMHIYDTLKLIILLGISWSEEGDFENEKEKIEFLNSMGRINFMLKLEIENV